MFSFFFQAEDGIRDYKVTGVQTCALPILIVDRISHEVEYYRGYLKHAVLQGTYVINNPFWWTADDKFFNYSVAAKLGIAIPKTVLLPQKGYLTDVDITSESLHNLTYPVDWDG